jgi:hypothetical protein
MKNYSNNEPRDWKSDNLQAIEIEKEIVEKEN